MAVVDAANHQRQDSMEPEGGWSEYDLTSSSTPSHQQQPAGEQVPVDQQQSSHIGTHTAAGRPQAHADILKPLVRRRLRHQRDLAHSLVGTPNYIAPEVLARAGQYENVWYSNIRNNSDDDNNHERKLADLLICTQRYFVPEVLALAGLCLNV